MLADGEGEQHVGEFGFGGRAFGDDLEIGARGMCVVAGLHEETARHRLECPALGARVGQAARDQQAQVLFRGEDTSGIGIGIRRDDNLGEEFGDFLRRRAIELAVERENAAKRADGIAGQCLPVSIGQG